MNQDVTNAAEGAVDAAAAAAETVLPRNVWRALEEFFETSLGSFVGKVILVAVTLLIMLAVCKWVNRMFDRLIARMKTYNTSGATLCAFVRYFALFGVYFAAFSIIVSNIPVLNAGMNKLLAAGGVIAVGLGVAGQEALGSIASGIIILISKPFVSGDVVNVVSSGVLGTVEDITLHHTVLRTIENKRVIVPNSTMNSAIVENYDYGERHVCLMLDIGITYESDVDRAMKLMADEVGRHPDYLDVRTPEQVKAGVPKVTVRVQELADSAVILRAWIWGADNGTTVALKADLMRLVKKRFDAEGIDLAYPHLVVVGK